ncbi:hypothetical protein DYBT9275_00581 [Dyadobacter sp. CECT 9275]|uniref:Uncharacterized protein n=1 Tax=Dyadobacter helix TaxID=2822344 RepID=A0A916JAD2_9BACT|nr:hypothetical protein [Dyadobacter sp. CECT 9275]CAG4990654.1 hypothetical protein DYBT9275_00581 [Dyadobacter sp. CECT 9275]
MDTTLISDKMVKSGTFKLFGKKLINIIIHRQDVVKISSIKRGRACVIYLRNNVPYTVGESKEEVYRKLSWSA